MHKTETLHIKNFGPINNAIIDINKITVMIGEQGSGKSTVAKLYALFTWLEKALMRHSLTIQNVTGYSRFRKTYCAYNNINDYFKPDTELYFSGIHYYFAYKGDQLEITETDSAQNDTFSISKVMYIPAERNILGSTDHPSRLKGLGGAMMTLLEEYDNAKIKNKNGYALPFGNAGFEYDLLNDLPKLRQADFEIKLSAASSGFQSALPMLLVSKNLSEMVRDSSLNTDLSGKEQKALLKEVESILNDDTLSEEVRKASLRTLSLRYRYSRFVNIVEEPELNLFPDSQKNVLYELVAETNNQPDNRLMLTTHSPYIINYLAIAVKAGQIASKANGNDRIMEHINAIVPLPSKTAENELSIYELSNGEANKLSVYEGIPSDNNFLNNKLNDTNLMFDKLLDIEENLNAPR